MPTVVLFTDPSRLRRVTDEWSEDGAGLPL
jgi:hypothetical protein